jgi:hypothetical protein
MMPATPKPESSSPPDSPAQIGKDRSAATVGNGDEGEASGNRYQDVRERCSSCRRWVSVVTDLALELHGLRELVREDEVELVAGRLESLHRLLGGEDVPAGRHRALARQILIEAAH